MVQIMVQIMEINEIIRLEVTSFSLSILLQVRSIEPILFLADYFSNLNISNDGSSLASLFRDKLRFLVQIVTECKIW